MQPQNINTHTEDAGAGPDNRQDQAFIFGLNAMCFMFKAVRNDRSARTTWEFEKAPPCANPTQNDESLMMINRRWWWVLWLAPAEELFWRVFFLR